MVNDQSYPDIQESSHKWKPEITDKENRKQLIEMAAEQFASLLWQQIHFEKEKKRKRILQYSN